MLSETTKGLNNTIFLIFSGTLSKGSIVFEKNSNTLPTNKLPNVEVSCVLNKYPSIIPNKINTDAINITATLKFNATSSRAFLKK